MYHIQKEDTRMSLMGKMGDWQVRFIRYYEGDEGARFTFVYKWELSLLHGSFSERFSRQY